MKTISFIFMLLFLVGFIVAMLFVYANISKGMYGLAFMVFIASLVTGALCIDALKEWIRS